MTTRGFWANPQVSDNRRVVVRDYGIISRIWYLFPQGDGPRGSFTTFADLAPNLRSRDTIFLSGVLREQAVAPLGVFDVSIIGAANQPRQATNSGVPTGGGASWLAPTSPVATTPLLELREQGWTIENIQMAGPEDAACIKMHCEETATYPDASHLTLNGVRFTGGLIGLEDYGGASNVLIENCSFEGMAGADGGAIVVTNQSIRASQRWMIRNNRFLPCVNGILGGFVDTQILNNVIMKSTTETINLDEGAVGARNVIYMNVFNIATADFDPAGGITGSATDTWVNYLSDQIEFGVPTN